MTIPVLTIDGPSGVGKGSVSRALAKKLGWHYLESLACQATELQTIVWPGG